MSGLVFFLTGLTPHANAAGEITHPLFLSESKGEKIMPITDHSSVRNGRWSLGVKAIVTSSLL